VLLEEKISIRFVVMPANRIRRKSSSSVHMYMLSAQCCCESGQSFSSSDRAVAARAGRLSKTRKVPGSDRLNACSASIGGMPRGEQLAYLVSSGREADIFSASSETRHQGAKKRSRPEQSMWSINRQNCAYPALARIKGWFCIEERSSQTGDERFAATSLLELGPLVLLQSKDRSMH